MLILPVCMNLPAANFSRRIRFRPHSRLLCLGMLCLLLASLPARAAAPQVSLTSMPADGSYGITEVSLIGPSTKTHPCRAQLGDHIEVLFKNPDLWLAALQKKYPLQFPKEKDGGTSLDEMLPRMVVFIEGKPMLAVPQLSFWEGPTRDEQAGALKAALVARPAEPAPADAPQAPPPGKPPAAFYQWVSFRYALVRNPSSVESKSDWDPVLKKSGLLVPMEISLGLLNDDHSKAFAAPSEVRLEDSKFKTRTESSRFFFRRVPANSSTIAGCLLLAAALVFFVYLIFRTPIVRDPALPVRPDGLPPASLGRCQMAFWFFLVAIAFFFLWLVTGRGDLDTINNETLMLIGISAATALGSAFIPCKNPTAETSQQVNYPAAISMAEKSLDLLRTERSGTVSGDDATRARLDTQIAEEQRRIRENKDALVRYRRLHRNQLLLDLLSESGNDVSFHRFQVVVWTLLLGVVFISEVLTKLAMPAFSSTLLLLMGVSSGTYLAFKFPNQKPPAAP